jgi:hypothetical protein
VGTPIYTINETSNKSNSSRSRSKSSSSPRPLSQKKEQIVDKLHKTQKPRRILLSSLIPLPEILRLIALKNAAIQPTAEPIQPTAEPIQPTAEPVQSRRRRFLDRAGIVTTAPIVPTDIEKEREMMIERIKKEHEQKAKQSPRNTVIYQNIQNIIESDRERERKRLEEYEEKKRREYDLIRSRAPQKLRTQPQPRQSLRYVYTGPVNHRTYTSSDRGPYIPIRRVVTQEASSGLGYSNSARGFYEGSELSRRLYF